jgi:hypothetical protein
MKSFGEQQGDERPMRRFTNFFKRFLKSFRDASGVSLYETTAVVAMTAIIGTVAAPIMLEKIENSKTVKAANEILTINGAIQKFFEHTGRWPGEAEIRRPGSPFCFLQSGVPSTDAAAGTLLPTVTSLGTAQRPIDASEFLGRPCNTITVDNVLNINNFLVRKPSVSDYPNWQGPYMEPIASDPWDRAYIINVLPLIFASSIDDPGVGQFADAVGKVGYGWIFSVGADRLLQTALSRPQLEPGSDDIGKNMGARILKSAGGQTSSSQ